MNLMMCELRTPSNWYVLTGRPSSGISTTLAALGRAGFLTVGEAAREVIDDGISSGATIETIRGDDDLFQRRVLARKIENERRLDRNAVAFLDRGLPDSIVYYSIAGMDTTAVRQLCPAGVYRKVFFMEPMPYAADYARTESRVVLDRLEKELRAVYLDLGYEVVGIPAAGVAERVRRILEAMGRPDSRDGLPAQSRS